MSPSSHSNQSPAALMTGSNCLLDALNTTPSAICLIDLRYNTYLTKHSAAYHTSSASSCSCLLAAAFDLQKAEEEKKEIEISAGVKIRSRLRVMEHSDQTKAVASNPCGNLSQRSQSAAMSLTIIGSQSRRGRLERLRVCQLHPNKSDG